MLNVIKVVTKKICSIKGCNNQVGGLILTKDGFKLMCDKHIEEYRKGE